MSKLTCLQILNEVEQNNGLTLSTSLTSLTGINLKCFNWINESIIILGVEDYWIPLESNETITLVTSTATYTKTSTINDFDKYSFRYDEKMNLTWRSPQEIDQLYPNQTNTGMADDIYLYGEYFKFPKIPTSAENGKTIKFRSWTIPTTFTTSTTTATCWFPEGWDRLVLVNYATYKVMEFRYKEEYKEYKRKVLGDREYGEEGYLSQMKKKLRSNNSTRMQVNITGAGGSRNSNRGVSRDF